MTSDISVLGSILGIWAHPDDETMTMGGIIRMAVNNGQTVTCITATKGEAGVQDESRWSREKLGEIRSAEMAVGMELLGVSAHHWLDLADGGCHEVAEEAILPRLIEYIDCYQPDTICTFPPDGMTGHPDHQAVSRWALAAAAASKTQPRVYFAATTTEDYDEFLKDLDAQFNIYFALDEPARVPMAECDIAVELEPDIVATKVAVMAAMPSQYQAWVDALGVDRLRQSLSREALISADRASIWADPSVQV